MKAVVFRILTMVIVMYYIHCFFVYSILGYIFEVLNSYLFHLEYESGILYGFWTPVYGFGVVCIFFLWNFFNRKIKNQFKKYLVLFVSCFILLGILELIGGYLIEFLFHETFWDYSNMKFAIGKYTSLEMCFLWGFLSIILVWFIKPIVDHFIWLIPSYVSCIAVLLMFLDVFITVIMHYKPF